MTGKITNFYDTIMNSEHPASKLVDIKAAEVIILIYMATEGAQKHLIDFSQRTWGASGAEFRVEAVQLLPSDMRLVAGDGNSMEPLINGYYDHSVHDNHMQKGRTSDSKYGFAACGLPVVLHHNTPNNSIALLWSYEDRSMRGLFPRIQRHKGSV